MELVSYFFRKNIIFHSARNIFFHVLAPFFQELYFMVLSIPLILYKLDQYSYIKWNSSIFHVNKISIIFLIFHFLVFLPKYFLKFSLHVMTSHHILFYKKRMQELLAPYLLILNFFNYFVFL